MGTKKKTMSKKAILDTLAKRVFAYKLLTRVLIEESNEEFLTMLMDNNLMESFPFQDDNEEMTAGLRQTDFYLKDPKLMDEMNIKLLRADFVSLFIGPQKMQAPPYESLYRSEKKLVFQEHTIQVRQAYAAAGFVPENLNREPDDYIGLEIDFMAKLSEKAYESARASQLTAARRALRHMKTFLTEHLSVWIDRFCDNAAKGAETDFYKGLAKVLRATVHVDEQLLDELLDGVAQQIKIQKEKAKTTLSQPSGK